MFFGRAQLVDGGEFALGTFLINASTSSGAGMTKRPYPNFLGNLPSPLSPYLGKSLESLSLAIQLTLICLSAMTSKTYRIEGTFVQLFHRFSEVP